MFGLIEIRNYLHSKKKIFVVDFISYKIISEDIYNFQFTLNMKYSLRQMKIYHHILYKWYDFQKYKYVN